MKIIQYESVELKVAANAASTMFPFTAQSTLTSDNKGDVGIRGIEIFTIDSIPVTPSGNPGATYAQIQNAMLVVTTKQKKVLNGIPLLKLLHLRNSAAAGYYIQDWADEFDDIEIDWLQTYVQIPAVFGVFVAFSYLFGFSYAVYNPGQIKAVKDARMK